MVYVSCPGSGETADGRFRLGLDTEGSDGAVKGLYVSTEIDANASAWGMLTSLENMPNVGTVAVEKTVNVYVGTGSNANTSVWEITFTSAVGDFAAVEVRILTFVKLIGSTTVP